MGLIGVTSKKLEEFFDADIPQYAILSHTWGPEEVSFQDINGSNAVSKAGYKKIEFVCSQAIQHDLSYAWVDTCCIDKSGSAELSEAINSMFNWYQKATRCYAYLADVSESKDSLEPILNTPRHEKKGFCQSSLERADGGPAAGRYRSCSPPLMWNFTTHDSSSYCRDVQHPMRLVLYLA
jgi:Heterokaryon incompatibility protein (HET)